MNIIQQCTIHLSFCVSNYQSILPAYLYVHLNVLTYISRNLSTNLSICVCMRIYHPIGYLALVWVVSLLTRIPMSQPMSSPRRAARRACFSVMPDIEMGLLISNKCSDIKSSRLWKEIMTLRQRPGHKNKI